MRKDSAVELMDELCLDAKREEAEVKECELGQEAEEEIYDIIIVGGGPCGLAAASRLREPTPAALFTDEEQRRYHFIGKHAKKMTTKHVRSGKIKPKQTATRPEYKMLILDASAGHWLGRWRRLFKTYGITHLRSLMIWHCDPQDRDALLAHAYHNGREDELVKIKNAVGKEISKHAKKKSAGQKTYGSKQSARVAINLREENDYYRPSSSLFEDHCDKVAERYRLGDEMMRHESLEHLDYDVVRGVSVNDEKLFTVVTNKTKRYAKAVVLAVGPANEAYIPQIPSMPNVKDLPQACHSMHIPADDFPAQIVRDRIGAKRETNILIVGGGLTSAQLADLAVQGGVTKVWHIMRGPMRVKHFDVSLEWMGKYKNAEQAKFWSADSDEERLEMIKEARGGGSLNPPYYKKTKQYIAMKKLELFTETHLVDAKFEDRDGITGWRVKTQPSIPDLPFMDYIYFATGIQTDFRTLPYLQTMLEKYPIVGQGGFPCINNDLMWTDGVPLFLTGRLAALRLGPAAPNLGGTKAGAERIAWAIEDLIPYHNEAEFEGTEKEKPGDLRGYLTGHGNMYSSLECE